MPFELIAHGVFSFVSGVSVAITGFGCDSARELFAELSTGPNAYPASSAINMGLSAALVTAVQAALQRRVIHGGLLLNTLPWTFIGVVLSLNVFSAAVLAALVPAVGACLLGLSLAKLWMELADRRHKASVRDGDDDGRRGANSWKWTGVLVVASIAGGLLSGRCPPPGPVFMVLLLASGEGVNVGGGEWRATAALVTWSSSLLRVGLLLLENGASAGPLSEVSVLVVGGLVGVAAGNFALRVLSSSGGDNGSEERRIPRPAAFRRCVLAVALTTSAAMAVGGPPAALASVSRPVVLGTLAVVCVVAAAGALWGCTRGAAGNGGARGVYGTVASDDRDVEVELKPFVAADDGPDSRGEDDDYLDEEDGYLADEGEEVEEEEQGVSGSRRVREQPRRGGDRRPPAAAAAVAVAVEVPSPRAKLSSPSRADGGALGGTGAGVAAHEGGKKEKKVKLAAPPAQSLFPAGHTMEL